MAYNYNTFLKPLNIGDKNLLIFNDAGELVYTINPFSVLNTQVRGNIITISVKSGRTILLDFLNSNYAIEALPILQDRIKTLTREVPNFIDKQVENWVLDQENNITSPTITGTLSMDGDIIPSLNDTWNLGSPTNRWDNIYVRDAIVSSQSLFLGDVKISTFNGAVLAGDQAISRYEGTSTTFITTPEIGEVVYLTTQDYLSYKYGDTLKVYNKEENFAEDDDYSEDSIYSYFVGRVDTYDPLTGQLSLITNASYNVGLTFSFWFIKLNTDVLEKVVTTFGTVSVTGNIVPSLDKTWNLGSTASKWNNLYVDEIFGDGDITLTEGKHLYSGGLRFSSRITGTSEDLLTVATAGYYFEMTTQKYLSFERGITVIVSNGLEDFYVDDDYYDDATAAVMFAIVDSYNETTGVLGLYVEKPIGLGRTASSWSINMSGRQATLELGPTASFEDLTVTGTTNIQQVVEILTTATSSPGLSPSTFNLNFDDGSIFYIEPEGDDFVANYLNVPTTDNRIISTTIIITQTASAYIPNNVIINGDIIPISWSGGSLPSGNANQTDIVGFSFMRIGATWSKVFGQLSTFTTL
jgi:hypothetical protein